MIMLRHAIETAARMFALHSTTFLFGSYPGATRIILQAATDSWHRHFDFPNFPDKEDSVILRARSPHQLRIWR